MVNIIAGYYDDTAVQLLESEPKTKQDVFVIFIDDEEVFDGIPVGVLSKYQNLEKGLLEEGAFERAMMEKHGNC